MYKYVHIYIYTLLVVEQTEYVKKEGVVEGRLLEVLGLGLGLTRYIYIYIYIYIYTYILLLVSEAQQAKHVK